jgi:hypothetical protein
VLVTGITKFMQIILFTIMKTPNDISLDLRFATIYGFKQNDIMACISKYFDTTNYFTMEIANLTLTPL